MINKHIILSSIFILTINIAFANQNGQFLQRANNLKLEVEAQQKSDIYKSYLEDARNISNKNRQSENNGAAMVDQGLVLESDSYKKNLSNLLKNYNLEQFKQELSQKQKKEFHQVMIFVSSSMPKESLIQYSSQARKIGAVLVLRGIINNSFRSTTQFILSLNKQGTKAIIDPHSFRNFNVANVPQVVVISDKHGCKDVRCAKTPLHDKIAGNISLEYALETLAKKGQFAKKESARFLNLLRG